MPELNYSELIREAGWWSKIKKQKYRFTKSSLLLLIIKKKNPYENSFKKYTKFMMYKLSNFLSKGHNR